MVLVAGTGLRLHDWGSSHTVGWAPPTRPRLHPHDRATPTCWDRDCAHITGTPPTQTRSHPCGGTGLHPHDWGSSHTVMAPPTQPRLRPHAGTRLPQHARPRAFAQPFSRPHSSILFAANQDSHSGPDHIHVLFCPSLLYRCPRLRDSDRSHLWAVGRAACGSTHRVGGVPSWGGASGAAAHVMLVHCVATAWKSAPVAFPGSRGPGSERPGCVFRAPSCAQPPDCARVQGGCAPEARPCRVPTPRAALLKTLRPGGEGQRRAPHPRLHPGRCFSPRKRCCVCAQGDRRAPELMQAPLALGSWQRFRSLLHAAM